MQTIVYILYIIHKSVRWFMLFFLLYFWWTELVTITMIDKNGFIYLK